MCPDYCIRNFFCRPARGGRTILRCCYTLIHPPASPTAIASKLPAAQQRGGGALYFWNLSALVFEQELPPSVRSFISRHVRSVEQLEILILLSREANVSWTVQKVYDAILSTPQSVERWLDEMVRNGLLEKMGEPAISYRCTTDVSLISQMRELGDIYHTRPVRVIEAIYRRDAAAAQSFADAFKIKNTDQKS